MPLQGELDAFKATWTERVGDSVAKMMEADNAALLPQAAKALKAGARFPGLTLPDQLGRAVDLGALADAVPLVVTFYRGGWCPYCNVHLGKIQSVEREVRDLGFQVVAISPDTPEKLAESLSKQALTYTLLSDSAMDVTRAFGLAFEVDDATRQRYRDFGIDLEAASGRSHHLLPVPAVYLVDRGGIVRFAHWNPDYTTRLGPEELLTAARGLATAP